MNKGKNIYLFLCAIVLIFLIFVGGVKIHSIATDSGFDTSYDSGGGSSSSGGSSSFGGSSSGGGSGNPVSALIMFEIFNTIFYYAIATSSSFGKNDVDKKKKIKKIFKIRIIVLILIDILYFVLYPYSSLFAILFALDFFGVFVYAFIHTRRVIPTIPDNKIQEILPGFNKEKFCSDAYQIYYDIQQAWMNFDYDNLRKLVTDELYNTYYNQLQTLALKNQKNIMGDFKLKSVKVVNVKVENNVEEIQACLKVSFFDYIATNDGEVVRGNKNSKVEMTYLLTFVRTSNKIDSCPGCGAKLEDNATVCEYCHANIQLVGEQMRLSKKEVIGQRK